MRVWIFQGNPDDYDIDGYLAPRPAEVVWLVTRYADEIAAGDRVYLWRNQGQQKTVAGIIAEAIVSAPPRVRDETPAPSILAHSGAPCHGATNASRPAVIEGRHDPRGDPRDWCQDDPILRALANLHMQAGTNYPVTPEQARRLSALWNRTGRDWNRSESVAGLWAYAQTFGQPVSQLAGSPVANVALLIGRAVSGVYAKVMNFRSIDPRVPGEGMSGAGETDRLVWAEFYDPVSANLRTEVLSLEFARLWPEAGGDIEEGAEASAAAATLADEAKRLEEQSLEQLVAKFRAQMRQRSSRPRKRTLATYQYDRDPLVVAIAHKRAGHRCEINACVHPTFQTKADSPMRRCIILSRYRKVGPTPSRTLPASVLRTVERYTSVSAG